MKDDSCIRFLQWALPHLHMRWGGFRKVRRQVCKRLGRRLEKLQLADLKGYQIYLADNPQEWHILDAICRITISRFYRDRGCLDTLQAQVLPGLIKEIQQQGRATISCWCIGAASGEEPYTISLIWSLSGLARYGFKCKILATEVDHNMINRAVAGCYPASSIRELPPEIKKQAFTFKDELFCLKEKFKQKVEFRQQDIRKEMPDKNFDLILCRNLVFTYFIRDLQKEITPKILFRLIPGGVLVIGGHEELPGPFPDLVPWSGGPKIYRKMRSG
jgi:chemotaxis protein methyltransferase CheR